MFKLLLSVILLSICSDQTFGAITPLIVGGEKVPIDKIPWQAYIQLEGGYCGGTIIGTNWILTAAHCTLPKIFSVRVGSPVRGCGGVVVGVNGIIRHPNYNSSILDYDFALLKLNEELDVTEKIKSVSLPDATSCIIEEQLCTVSGWGNTEDPDQSSEWLREVSIPIVNQNTCKYYDYSATITDRMVCAGYKYENSGFSSGDSGGPLVCLDIDDGNLKLFGVASFTVSDANNSRLGVYGRVTAVRKWIAEKTGITEGESTTTSEPDGVNGDGGVLIEAIHGVNGECPNPHPCGPECNCVCDDDYKCGDCHC